MYSVAIDGPAGSGKSTVAKELAKELNITYIDTGAMYRALAYKSKMLKAETDSDILRFLEFTRIDYKNDKIYLDGKDVSLEIREYGISRVASDISKKKFVRDFLVSLQRKISKEMSVVMEGRDIGTVVLKDAKFKFFLTASIDVRSLRRYEQLKNNSNISLEKIKEDLLQRDYNDENRANSPLKRAIDAHLIDNSNMNLKETVNYMLSIIRRNEFV